MAVPWLLIAAVGLAATEVSCQPDGVGGLPLPTAGMLLIYKQSISITWGFFYKLKIS